MDHHRREMRYKRQPSGMVHNYDERYHHNGYDNYDYEEDYGNQYSNSDGHHQRYDDEEDHWADPNDQTDFYDSVPVTNPQKPNKTPTSARVQISTMPPPPPPSSVMQDKSSSIPQAPPPPRFGPGGGFKTDLTHKSKYGVPIIEKQQQQRLQQQNDVHIRFDPQTKNQFPPKQTSYIDGYRSAEVKTNYSNQPKNERLSQPSNAIKSIINNFRTGNGNETKQEDSIPRNRVSTNPFIRANKAQQQMVNNNNNSRMEPPKNPSKNVAEVVEKMNNGDWPIKIEEDEMMMQEKEEKLIHETARSYINPDKARQWETLHRKKEEKPSILKDERLMSPPQKPPQTPSFQQQQQQKDEEAENVSQEEEQTSVSTDSALCTDLDQQRGISPYQLPFEDQKRNHSEDAILKDEAEKLMMYFSTHRDVVNYLGIGLPERIWQHMSKLPKFDAAIRIFKNNEPKKYEPNHDQPAPKITLTPSYDEEKIQHHPEQHAQMRTRSPAASQNDGYQMDQNPRKPNEMTARNNGGRFVKKSAAALVAKKQGIVSEDPNSATEIIDPRIAEEIKNLRDREEELRRTRSELVLDSDMPMGHIQHLRPAQSYDHLSDEVQHPIGRSHSSHNVYIESSESYNHHNHTNMNANYGSMPRAHSRIENQYSHVKQGPRLPQGSRNPEFFRIPPGTKTSNTHSSKSITPFEAKSPKASPSSASYTALQLASVSRTSDDYKIPKSIIQHANRKIGL